jgi:ribosomal protein L37E
MADALILFSIHHWAQRNKGLEVHFYTFNTKDFSEPTNKNAPHDDIKQFFAPASNVSYHSNLGTLLSSISGLDPIDFYPEPAAGRCARCNERVPIETLNCNSCGETFADHIDEDSYTLTPYRDGHLVDAGERLQCGRCGRKTFHVELATLCSYCDHAMSKDD